MWTVLSISAFAMYAFLSLAELVLSKCLYLFLWSRMSMMDDNFIAHFCHAWNIMMAAGMVLVRLLFGEHRSNPFFAALIGEKVIPSILAGRVNFL